MSRTDVVEGLPCSRGLVGPSGFACGSSPLLLPIYNFLFGRRCGALGYHPDGIKPITWLSLYSRMLTTAMQVLSALATNSIPFFASSASAFGVLPAGARSVGPT